MRMTTVKVSTTTRDRLRTYASTRELTLGAVIETALDALDEQQFWLEVRTANAQPDDEWEAAATREFTDRLDAVDPIPRTDPS